MQLADARRRLIVPLDLADRTQAIDLAQRLAGHVGLVKVGLELFVAHGPSIVTDIRERHPELEVFLDLKLHDIPNTMRGAIRSAKRCGARFITVHAGSGVDHLRACVEEAADDIDVLGVTVLTSQDAHACKEAGHTRDLAELVEMRAVCAREAGCSGLVCSGLELARVQAVAPSLCRVVPGIRPAGSARGDQQRVMTPAEAVRADASYLVVGRPITDAADPVAAADAIVDEIAAADR
ncbi:MAG: orotidine-5'-phosphate decarboxylase [Myxococcales bacterium FL481]|nr:MAG: orotidine-5'-phosphate decarboxylase [Myxococcales bacterium FL481]